MKRAWLPTTVILCAAAGAGYFLIREFGSSSVTPVVQAAPEAPYPKVAALGRIRPLSDVLDLGADPTRRVAKLLVSEGQQVKQGEILAYLDNYDELLASANYAQSQLAGGQSQLAARTALDQVNLAKAEADLKSVEVLNPKSISVQELTIEKLQAERALAQIEAERYEQMFNDRSSSREQFDKKKTELTAKEMGFQSAQADLAKLKDSFGLDREKAQHNVAASQANLKLTAANLDLDSLAKNVELAQARLATSLLKAPVDGQILKLHTRPGEVVRNQIVLTMADLSTMSVMAEVYETDVLRIQIGQPATITATALTTPITGEVVLIGRLINKQTVTSLDPAAPLDARTAEVRIRLKEAEVAARLINLQVTATIETK